MTAATVRRRRAAHLRPGWRMPWLAFATATVFFLGTVVLLAPTIANWFSQLEQAREIVALSEGVDEHGPQWRLDALAAAHAYNATLTGGALVGAGERIPQSAELPTEAGEFDYESLLRADSHGLMARIKIPAIGVDLPVYHGTSDETLERAAGHLERTALPVGGAGTRSVITAHRGLATSELFTNLDRVEIGDTFTIEVFGEVLTYQVESTEVVQPDDSRALYPELGRDLVTLVTCTPLGINSHRILVTGERILPTPERDVQSAGAPPTIPGFAWWIVILAAVLLAASVYVWFDGRPPRTDAGPQRPRREARR